MKNTAEYIEEIRNLIAAGDLSEALGRLRTLLSNARQLDEALHQSGRFEEIRRLIRLGTVSHEEASLTQNQIRAALLDLLREIEAQQERQPAVREEVERAVTIIDSKNVVTGNISARGNISIGDTTTITESDMSRRLRLFFTYLCRCWRSGRRFCGTAYRK